jgi:hypothetical protein
MKPCPHHTGVVENHQRPLGQILGQMAESILADVSVTVHKQLALVALGKGEFRYTILWQRVIIVLDVYMLRLHHTEFACKGTLF